MEYDTRTPLPILGLSLLLASGSPFAQTPTSQSVCMVTGSAAAEPVGDREGHFIQVSLASCRVNGGPLDGGVMTQNSIWEIDKGRATLVSGTGVMRKQGGIAVYQGNAGARAPVVKDGQMVGWTASGKSVFTMAAGTASAVLGKTFSWTAKMTGDNQYVIDSVMD